MSHFNPKTILFRLGISISILILTFNSYSVSADNHSPADEQGEQKVVLVTGASSGIGRSIAETLAKQGVFVYAGARKDRDITALSSIKNIQGIRLDVTRWDQIDAAVKLIQKAGRGLDGLVNNAGVFLHAPLIEVSEEDMQFMMDVNLFGPYRISKAFAPLIIESKGRIATIGSVAGVMSGSLFGPYAMSKHAMEAYTDSLAGEMAKFEVEVSLIDPGNFRSNIMQNMEQRAAERKKEKPNSLYHAEFERLVSFTQADRSHHSDPIEVANAVADALFAEAPKRRYLVTPNKQEATMAIRSVLRRAVQLNHNQAYSFSQEELVALLKQQLQAIAE